MKNHYPITLHHFFTSPKHNYFTRAKFEVGDAPTISHTSLNFEEGGGIKGDRFEESLYPVIFFSLEVSEAIEKAFDRFIDYTTPEKSNNYF